ncbi:MAG: hypothetical protein K0B15_01920 [Lentimicrobium sp.]|nr:hypothetical protein [Lentimicrobium sp.]
MNYSESYSTLSKVFRPKEDTVFVPTLDLNISQFRFLSEFPSIEEIKGEGEKISGSELETLKDEEIPENLDFFYPVVYPANKREFNRVVILLHGLNERNWVKYLPWAHKLAENLYCPVILFPISFHMNRAPSSWSNPRLMSAILAKTRLRNNRNRSATFANLALSIRLSQKPQRFFTSGSQSLADLMKLVAQIQSGNHPLLKKDTKVDFFAYSIGAFLSQIMMLTYGDSKINDSCVFIFCGGAPFNRMNGISKLIMDEEAFHCLRFFYLRRLVQELRNKGPFAGLLNSQNAGQAFRAMIDTKNFSEWRKDKFEKMAGRIHAIGLKKDIVIPPDGISELFQPSNSEILDFPYNYSHENPFPVQGAHDMVNQGFDLIINKAASFLR